MIRKISLGVFMVCLLLAVSRQPAGPRPLLAETVCQQPFLSVALPLSELGSTQYVRMNGETTAEAGGLYPDGRNVRPPQHEAAGTTMAAQIRPLNPAGAVDVANGRIVMITIGMSNTDQESRALVDLVAQQRDGPNPTINARVLLVNGAAPGQSAEHWLDPHHANWRQLDERLTDIQHGGAPGVTPLQVQVAWIKQAHPMHARTTAFPDHAQELQMNLEQIVRNLKTNYPNVKIAYLSSRTRSYGYWDGASSTWGLLNPEPAAYETGFAVKWLIAQQIGGEPQLNYDPQQGTAVAPYLSWGPYLWVNESPRADGFTWTQADLEHDCTHPSSSGEQKVARLLVDFWLADTTAAPWFARYPPQSYSQYLPLISAP